MDKDWMEEENKRAEALAKTGGTTNSNAPKIIFPKKKITLMRNVKSIYIQNKHSAAFDRLAFNQKMTKGKKAPELAEEAIELLLKKYKEELK